jgi:pimeloyl-ACP methyl ester carboxylesterase
MIVGQAPAAACVFLSTDVPDSPEYATVSLLPRIHYTRSADRTNLAYQVSGDGPLEMVLMLGGIPIDLAAEEPGIVRLRKRLTGFSRAVWFDARGRGASEGEPRDAILEEVFAADLTAVLDAAGFERPVLVMGGEGGGLAIHFAVNHPERVSALVLVNSCAYYVREDDYPWGTPPESLDHLQASINAHWGRVAPVDFLAPSLVGDERFKAWFTRTQRVDMGPDQVAAIVRAAFERDVRELLPALSCPTLVLHREGDRYIHLGAGQYLAEHIPDARLVVLPGDDHLAFVGDTDALADEIEEFLTGARSGAEGDAELAVVLFTDIVASTEHQARVGAREWSRLKDRHDTMAREMMTRYRGHEVNTTGDGFLATFNATGRALRCATEIVTAASSIGLNLRAGVHAGEIEARGNDLGGLAVIIAKRVCDLAGPGEVLVSSTVVDVVAGSGFAFAERGEHSLKGVSGAWRLFVLTS